MTGKVHEKKEDILKRILMEGLLKVRDWLAEEDAPYLKSIFDQVGFRDRIENSVIYHALPICLSSEISYPVQGKVETLRAEKNKLALEVCKYYKGLSAGYLNSLSPGQLFFLLEKFGGNIPIDEAGLISIFDGYKIKAAKALIQANRQPSDLSDYLLINIDLSGIQKFIYNISSEGALKNLRTRSFFIELLGYQQFPKGAEIG